MKTRIIICSALACASTSAMDTSKLSKTFYQAVAARATASITQKRQTAPSESPKTLYGTFATNLSARSTQNQPEKDTARETASTSPIGSPISSVRMIPAIDNATRLPNWIKQSTDRETGMPCYINTRTAQLFQLLP